MEKWALLAVMIFILWRFYSAYRSGGLKALFEKSRAAPQHWQTFGLICAGILLLLYLLIKL